MDTHLLIAIRLSKKRLLPAIEKRIRSKPSREFIMRWARVFSPLKDIPISINHDKRFFLDAFASPNSKALSVVKEFENAEILNQELFTKEQKTSSLILSARLVYYTLLALPVLLRVFKNRKSLLNEVDLQVIIGYASYKLFLKNNKKIIPIIISDITPTAHMLWAAVVSLKREVFWWQDDHHHYNGFSDENYFPYTSTYAAVLNQKGLETVLEKSPNARIFYRDQTVVKPLREIPNNPRVGIATNAFFEATPEQIELLKQVKKKLNIELLKIRLHPNSKLSENSFPAALLRIAPKNESIESFSDSVDIAIVGNSAVQLRLLCEGLPVIHISGLDIHGYDNYKYCQNGFCFGLEGLSFLDLNALQKFYTNPFIANLLFEYVKIKDVAQYEPLSKLSKNNQ
ncbi:hypothetical protein MM213_01115 [Belliella sp. R4-6]|uniref:Capsule polysaccharide biosynthesis protein n=1 Tax=Belliella alkalica TaxID=1730871 RepID=A0ABS9V6L3_9BACT|nr:hypothetical protein [Belliella alkalica]MCH7412066.1 hypothetical protein [Belliella alkalica]